MTKRFGSRAKGKVGEREAAKLLQAWWRQLEPECEMASCPLSGGWNTPTIRGGMKLSGDLCTTAEKFPFVVEVKRRENFSWGRLLDGKASPVWGWWAQCCKSAAEQGGFPLLLFRKNREPWSFFVRYSDANMLLYPGGALESPDGEEVIIGGLESLLDRDPMGFVK